MFTARSALGRAALCALCLLLAACAAGGGETFPLAAPDRFARDWSPAGPATVLVRILDDAAFDAACARSFRATRGQPCPPRTLAFAVPDLICNVVLRIRAPAGAFRHELRRCYDGD